jgi:ligand-binding SRPBCC domain-containing protein
MPLIVIETEILSDIDTCFDMARNIDIHKESLKHTGEIPVSGKTTGLIGLGEWVRWEAQHLGFVQYLTSRITEFERPVFFVDEMISGAFKSYRHEHIFKERDGKTTMTDKFYFESPYGVLGKLANWLFLKNYMRNLLLVRNKTLKQKAELLVLK